MPVPSTGANANPCVNAAPCGDSGLPSAPSNGPSGKGATPAVRQPLLPMLVGQFVPFSQRCELPEERASRLDEPPERLAVA